MSCVSAMLTCHVKAKFLKTTNSTVMNFGIHVAARFLYLLFSYECTCKQMFRKENKDLFINIMLSKSHYIQKTCNCMCTRFHDHRVWKLLENVACLPA
jgi:hypothetical protein